MVSPAGQVSGGIERAFQIVVARGAVMIVLEIVFAGPKQLHGRANHFRNPPGLQHVVIGQSPSEAAARTQQVNRDILRRNTHQFGNFLARVPGSLRRRPEFNLAVGVVSHTIFRFHLRVGEEGIRVRSLHHFRRRLKRGIDVAIDAQG